MNRRAVLVARIALFAALIYVLNWGTAYLPNVSLMFFIVFTAGLLWGAVPGILVGMIGMGLWTTLNPYGPAPMPVTVAQVGGAGAGGVVGALFGKTNWLTYRRWPLMVTLILAGVVCTLLFYIPVNLVDAWVFGPFKERLIGGLAWSGISLVVNAVVFPVLFPMVRLLYGREHATGAT